MNGISPIDSAPGAAQLLMMRKMMDSSAETASAILAAMPTPVPPQARTGELLL